MFPTVGDLIDLLETFERDEPIRILTEKRLEGVKAVRFMKGRAVLIPTVEEQA